MIGACGFMLSSMVFVPSVHVPAMKEKRGHGGTKCRCTFDEGGHDDHDGLGERLALCSPFNDLPHRPDSPVNSSSRYPLANHMRKVLHVGPCDTPGGMATVMHTLAESPSEGWQAKLIASCTRRAVGQMASLPSSQEELIRQCSSSEGRPDVVHVHTAADWSWRRKAQLISIATPQHPHRRPFSLWTIS